MNFVKNWNLGSGEICPWDLIHFLCYYAFECGKTVIDVCEAYTSKTNNFTGVIDAKLGGKKRIPVGESWVDRDINGALGILLKALGDLPELHDCLRSEFAIVNEC